ncbi:hypothetical protein A4A49_06240 [Nicotiana attenuata]|uniref:Uncharacterized protein n=1 Tax=Nicotiana attenuata TaxID=49451 RepID=A0A1J6ILZ5_NICAT|nr:hypothetical protein A4A49_06240 [Nicotiana attenuata]
MDASAGLPYARIGEAEGKTFRAEKMELALRDPNWIGICCLWGVNRRLLKAHARLSSFVFPNSSENYWLNLKLYPPHNE